MTMSARELESGLGARLYVYIHVHGSRSSVVRAPATKAGGPGFDFRWLPWIFLSLLAGLLMLMGWRICGVLVQLAAINTDIYVHVHVSECVKAPSIINDLVLANAREVLCWNFCGSYFRGSRTICKNCEILYHAKISCHTVLYMHVHIIVLYSGKFGEP